MAAPQVTTLSGREAEIHISKDDLSGKSFGAFATQPSGVAFKVLPEIDDLKPGHIRYSIKVMVADTTGRQSNDHTQAASSTAQELVATGSAEENVPVLFELGSVGKERKRTAVFIFRSLPPTRNCNSTCSDRTITILWPSDRAGESRMARAISRLKQFRDTRPGAEAGFLSGASDG